MRRFRLVHEATTGNAPRLPLIVVPSLPDELVSCFAIRFGKYIPDVRPVEDVVRTSEQDRCYACGDLVCAQCPCCDRALCRVHAFEVEAEDQYGPTGVYFFVCSRFYAEIHGPPREFHPHGELSK